jgi:uroporphyrinogen-III synthase
MSSTGVKLLFDNLVSQRARQQFLDKTSCLAVGPRTKETLASYGATRTIVPERYSSAGVEEFFSKINVKNLRIVLIRSSSADDSLANSLASSGAIVTTVNAYESLVPEDQESTFSFLKGLASGRFSAVLFTSAISVSNLFKMAETKFDESQVVDLLRHLRVGAIGPATAMELQRRGIEPVIPEEYLIEAALKKLVNQ